MKKVVVICTMCLSAFSAYAIGKINLVELGLKAGTSTRNITTQQMPGVGFHSRTGLHTALMGRISFGSFHIQPEILYTTSAYWLDFTSSAGTSRAKVRTKTWDFPLLIGKRFFHIMRAQIGPVFDLMTNNTVKLERGVMPEVITTRAMMGYMFGLGADFHQRKINIDLRYNGAFKRSVQSIMVGSDPAFSVKTGMKNWMISVGYMF